MSKARDLAGLFNLNPTSGTTAQRPATADVGDIYYNGTTGKTEIYTTTGWKEMASGIPFGNTAARPTGVTGQPYFNGQLGRLEVYTASTGWQNIVPETPTIGSITGTYLESTNSGTITIYGTNFQEGAYATATGSNSVPVDASSTTYNSAAQLTAVFTGLSALYEPYDIKVTNPSNLFGIYADALYVNNILSWQTAAGSLGSFTEQISVSVSVNATDSDSIVTYALASGSSLPSGVTLNSSTGVISGTLPNIASDTTYTFTINASDGANAAIPRTFSITSISLVDAEYLVVAGGGSGGSYYYGGGGGGGFVKAGTSALGRSTTYQISVGSGGAQAYNPSENINGNPGENSVFSSFVSNGGSGGITLTRSGMPCPGGAQGTASTSSGGGTGASDSVSTSGGGGGAGGAGGNGTTSGGGIGGVGVASSITGTSTFYGGGGGGSSYANYARGLGGNGGGGNGCKGTDGRLAGSAGGTNTGGGGGGGSHPANGLDVAYGYAGGSGIVILAYPNTVANITTIPSNLIYTLDTSSRPGYKVYKFTAGSGTVTF
jgi:hypothetical protein